ncbi:hypothetical protein LCGC14_1022680 [marine sediment metagenome]|uniref:Uncharacterized protein n=1 Tax=marine sediment metagenome TaxID=412755 RepID=A0A0F9MX38_9ZZZZ
MKITVTYRLEPNIRDRGPRRRAVARLMALPPLLQPVAPAMRQAIVDTIEDLRYLYEADVRVVEKIEVIQ